MRVLQRGSKGVLLFALLFLLFIPTKEGFGMFVCGPIDTVTWTAAPSTGTLKAVVIYACSTGAATIQLPSWAKTIWDSSKQVSVPRYYRDNSLGKYHMNAVAYGAGNNCFTAAVPPLTRS